MIPPMAPAAITSARITMTSDPAAPRRRLLLNMTSSREKLGYDNRAGPVRERNCAQAILAEKHGSRSAANSDRPALMGRRRGYGHAHATRHSQPLSAGADQLSAAQIRQAGLCRHALGRQADHLSH